MALFNRPVQGGALIPVAVVGGEDSSGIRSRYVFVSQRQWHYLDGATINQANEASVVGGVAVAIPAGVTIVEIRPEDEDAHFAINAALAGPNSYGYVAAGGGEIIGPLDNLNTLRVYQIAGGLIHIMFFREA